MHNVLEIIKVR